MQLRLSSSAFAFAFAPPLLRLLLLFFFFGCISLIHASSRLQFLERIRNQNSLHSYSFPVFHSSSLPDPQLRGRTLQQTSSNQTLDLRSQLITLDEPFGQYFALLQLGTPAKEITVIIDTGSQFLWVQCDPCTECGVQIREPIFDPSKSSTYKNIACTTSDASSTNSCKGDDSIFMQCGANGACEYKVTYGDNSNSSGYVSMDTLTFDTAQGTTFQLKDVQFGCGLINNGVESQLNASGLMGLDLGNFSIPSQLGVEVFSYCLPDRVKDVHSSGYLTFGNSSNSASKNLQYTPLIVNSATAFLSQFYYLNITGVSINDHLLDIPTSAFEIDSAGNGGTIIDSGTSLTSFVDAAYNIVASAFESSMDPSVEKADINGDESSELCYRVPSTQNQAPTAPSVTIHLDGPVDLAFGTDQLFRFIGSDATYNYFCMAFSNAGTASDARNFIGNYQQQDFLVEYDVGNSRIGFAPTQCSNSSDGISLNRRQSYIAVGLIQLLAYLILL